MNRTIKEATVKRYHYDSHDQLGISPTSWLHKLRSRLKTLSGLTPYEYIAKIRTSEPDRFIVNPIHQMLGLNNPLGYTNSGNIYRVGDPFENSMSGALPWSVRNRLSPSVHRCMTSYRKSQVNR